MHIFGHHDIDQSNIFKAGPAGFTQSFGKWLDSTDYRNMIATGKGKLEWERKIPEEQINDLKVLLEADNFDENLPAVSITITVLLLQFKQ